jgi:hypothetical protein
MAARLKLGTSKEEMIFSAKTRPRALSRETTSVAVWGRRLRTTDLASSREIRLRNSLCILPLVVWKKI